MTTYNNKYWILKNIRNSFIDSDRTGLCENIGKLCYQNALEGKNIVIGAGCNDTFGNKVVSACNGYPRFENTDEEFDLKPELLKRFQEFSFQRKKQIRCGTKTIKRQELNKSDEQKKDLSSRKKVDSGIYPQNSLFTDMLQNSQYVPRLTYTKYAEYDGTYLCNVLTILYHIYVAIGPGKRSTSFIVSIINAAKYEDLIGLVCYKLSTEYAQNNIPLRSVESYALCITDDEGNIVWELSHLDPHERCSTKYGSKLSIIERKSRDFLANVSENVSKKKGNKNLIIDNSQRPTGHRRHCDISDTNNYGLAFIEVPLNRVFRLTWLQKRIEVDMVVSMEKVTIIPCRTVFWKFWINRKGKEYDSHKISSCEIINSKCGCKVRLKYTKNNLNATNEGSSFEKHHDFSCSYLKATEILECISNTLVCRDEGYLYDNI